MTLKTLVECVLTGGVVTSLIFIAYVVYLSWGDLKR